MTAVLNPISVPLKLGAKIIAGNVPVYAGATEVTPSAEEQILYTRNKKLEENIIVKEIPFAETSNLSGGYTAVIG